MNATNSVLVVTQLIVIPYDTMQTRWMMCFLFDFDEILQCILQETHDLEF